MSDFLFRGSLADLDPELHDLTQVEAERQYRKLILIPSESSAPLAAREGLASAFQNIYAEGYPKETTRRMTEPEILDYEARLAQYRRLSDPRYYKGVEYADAVEALARRRCAEIFAANGVAPDDLFVNVQPLSGAPANNAVYHALIQPGATVMGMDLLHGGHLTHGSPVNRSGKYYNIVHYGVDPEDEKINYDQVEALAREHKPKMIIAGYSSYPWAVDWARFRQIADTVGAYLLADVAHVAGLIAGGVYPSPVGLADVITFTTHKSLCGPRGAAIITGSRRLSEMIDRAVFPGEQGGPHINTMVGQALAFKLARSDQFKALQRQIVVNSVSLTEAIRKAGLRIPFGGTDTHLSNVDCGSVVGPDGSPLSGDMAARILDIVGIVVNRNTIPGDISAAQPSGIRIGTPWITQRGFTEASCRQLGGLMAEVLLACKPYAIPATMGLRLRAKIDFERLNEAKMQVRDLATSMGIDFEPTSHGYPHFYYLDDPAPEAPYTVVQIEGERAGTFLRWSTTARPSEIESGEVVRTILTTPEGEFELALRRGEDDSAWSLIVPSEKAPHIITWLRDLSDGYVTVDPLDLHRKIIGPIVVREAGGQLAMPEARSDGGCDDKPWCLGLPASEGDPLPQFEWIEPDKQDLRRTALFDTHKALGAKIVPFAGWEMPVWYTSVLEEHVATRTAAGLFDVSHMGVYQVEGPGACAFLDCVAGNAIYRIKVGTSRYTQFLDPDGTVIDDAMVYRRGPDTYLIVANAANDDKNWAWLNAVLDGQVRIDNQRPWGKVYGRTARLRNLRDPVAGEDMLVDIAIQGPRSREILLALGCDEETSARLQSLPWANLIEGKFGGIDLVVSRTGYTGERVAYELFVHPESSAALWLKLLDAGGALGLKPVGLGARDSLRTEAGLPLYGHEIAGEMGLTVGEAGFAGYIKTYKPWFIGRDAFLKQEVKRDREVVRFRFDDKGVRMAHYGDPVVDRRGRVIGQVTSCAVGSEGFLLGQAVLKRKHTSEGKLIAVFSGAGKAVAKSLAEVSIGDKLEVPSPARVLSRFPER